MRKTVRKSAKKQSSATLKSRVKELISSQKAAPKKTKRNADRGVSYRDALLAKQVESRRSERGVNPQNAFNPAHAPGHRRINLKAPARS